MAAFSAYRPRQASDKCLPHSQKGRFPAVQLVVGVDSGTGLIFLEIDTNWRLNR
jgi:hypothetical protein